METVLFGSVMLAVGWLVLWCCVDHSRPSKTWWPFDFRLNPMEDEKKPTAKAPPRRGAPVRSQRWRQSGS